MFGLSSESAKIFLSLFAYAFTVNIYTTGFNDCGFFENLATHRRTQTQCQLFTLSPYGRHCGKSHIHSAYQQNNFITAGHTNITIAMWKMCSFYYFFIGCFSMLLSTRDFEKVHIFHSQLHWHSAFYCIHYILPLLCFSLSLRLLLF